MATVTQDSTNAARRAVMVQQIEAEAKATAGHTGRESFAPRVLQAMAEVPRHRFVRDEDQGRAYDNGPLPIGQGQTISQPYMVALMTDLLELKGDERVLEIGYGSGYQTAVLAHLAARVFAIELSPLHAEAAKARLAALQIGNVALRVGDGNLGWPEEAPFDAILVAAAPSTVPDALVVQLRAPGHLVVPIGCGRPQELLLVVKDADGRVTRRSVLPVAFVPLVKP